MTKRKRSEDDDHLINADNLPCPVCGHISFVWGKTTGHTSSGFRFMRNEGERFQRGRWIRARQCKRCGNILLFTRE